jgi:hypothetical protein
MRAVCEFFHCSAALGNTALARARGLAFRPSALFPGWSHTGFAGHCTLLRLVAGI